MARFNIWSDRKIKSNCSCIFTTLFHRDKNDSVTLVVLFSRGFKLSLLRLGQENRRTKHKA